MKHVLANIPHDLSHIRDYTTRTYQYLLSVSEMVCIEASFRSFAESLGQSYKNRYYSTVVIDISVTRLMFHLNSD